MPEELPAEICQQIDSVPLLSSRPLIICDADGVLVEFMFAFEAYLEYRGCYFDWSSFRLVGNVRRLTDDQPIESEEVRGLLDDFYSEKTEELEPLPGAASALTKFSGRAQIVVLSNIPVFAREGRASCLRRHGMDFPVITGSGGKGPAVHRLSSRVQAPAVFIDDIPRNHTSVAQIAEHVTRIYFSADTRLTNLFGPSEDSQHFAADWTEASAIIDRCLSDKGY
tara:strand:- start:144 stop:815 length:672 start_codon:yes stop_codon:yes gene_type:complete